MGIGWRLYHRKITRVPKYLNDQSPQPNPHTFFFTLKNKVSKIHVPHYIKIFMKIMNFYENYEMKKNEEKIIMGIGWDYVLGR